MVWPLGVVENAAVMVLLGLEGVNVPRRRNMAEGFSLESLCERLMNMKLKKWRGI